MPTGKVRLAGTEHSPLFLLLRGGCGELLHARRTLPSTGSLAWARAWGHPELGQGNRRQEETRSCCLLHLPRPWPLSPFRAGPARNRPGQASAVVPPAPEKRRGRGQLSRAGEPAQEPAVAACSDPPPGPAPPARPRLREKRALKRASPRPGARDRGRGAGIGASWKVTAAGARRAGRSTMGAGSPGGRPPPPPQRRAGFPERSGLEPRVCCRRCGQPGAANRRARDPRFPRAAGREPLRGDRRGSALAGAGVRAPG